MITLNPQPEKRSCLDYDFLKSCLQSNSQRYVLEAKILLYVHNMLFNLIDYNIINSQNVSLSEVWNAPLATPRLSGYSLNASNGIMAMMDRYLARYLK